LRRYYFFFPSVWKLCIMILLLSYKMSELFVEHEHHKYNVYDVKYKNNTEAELKSILYMFPCFKICCKTRSIAWW
jgi:hypothetical protein